MQKCFSFSSKETRPRYLTGSQRPETREIARPFSNPEHVNPKETFLDHGLLSTLGFGASLPSGSFPQNDNHKCGFSQSLSKPPTPTPAILSGPEQVKPVAAIIPSQ